MNLLEMANERVKEINQVMGNLEEVEAKLSAVVKDSTVGIYTGPVITRLDDVVPAETMGQLVASVTNALTGIRQERESRLKELLGIATSQEPVPAPDKTPAKKRIGRPKKASSGNSVPAESVPEAERQPAAPQYPELNPELVKRLYIEDGKNLQEIAAYFGKTKMEIREYVEQHHIFRPSKTPDGFRG